MTQNKTAHGKCLCGKVSIEIKTAKTTFGACHCGMCRKWGGGPYLSMDAGTDVTLKGDVKTFNSSDWAERGFCGECGTHLFYRLKQSNHYFVAVGLMDDAASYQFDHQVFIDKKPANYDFVNQTKNMTEAQVFAKFGG